MPMINPSLSMVLLINLNFGAQITARIIAEIPKRRPINHKGVMLVRAFFMMEKDDPQIAVARMMPQDANIFLLVSLLVIFIILSKVIYFFVKRYSILINIIF